MVGSIEYNQTWKQKTTPLGIAYWAHTASARTIYVNVSTGAPQLVPAPTPKKSDDQVGRMGPEATARRMARTDASRELSMDVTLCAWPKTPAACDGEGGTFDVMKGIRENLNPGEVAQMAGWATAAATTWGGTPEAHLERKRRAIAAGAKMGLVVSCLDQQVLGVILPLFFVLTGARVALDETFSLWLMAFPGAWARSAPNWKERQAWRDFLKNHYEKQSSTGSSDLKVPGTR